MRNSHSTDKLGKCRRGTCISRKKGLCLVNAIIIPVGSLIEDVIRCAGSYRVRAKTLKLLANPLRNTYGNVNGIADVQTPQSRAGLLSLSGSEEETADTILFSCHSRKSFVNDIYIECVVRYIGIPEKRQDLKFLFEKNFPDENNVYSLPHTQIGEYTKEFCAKKRCSEFIRVNSNE